MAGRFMMWRCPVFSTAIRSCSMTSGRSGPGHNAAFTVSELRPLTLAQPRADTNADFGIGRTGVCAAQVLPHHVHTGLEHPKGRAESPSFAVVLRTHPS
jgi:hypothetical protein